MFFVSLFVFYQYYSNTTSIDIGDVQNVRIEAQAISNFLMSEGHPENWNSTNVQRIGIVDQNFRLNESKLNELALLEYSTTRGILDTKYDYYFYFLEKNGEIANITAYGKPGINSTNLEEIEDPKKVVSLSRFVFYNRKIIRMVLNVWD
jgi:hypothetical protein